MFVLALFGAWGGGDVHKGLMRVEGLNRSPTHFTLWPKQCNHQCNIHNCTIYNMYFVGNIGASDLNHINVYLHYQMFLWVFYPHKLLHEHTM